MEFRGGAGGYGGITTMNTEQRTGRYSPHLAVSKITDYLTDTVHVTCLTCGEKWEHPRSVPSAPDVCTKPLRVEGNNGELGDITSYVRRWSNR